jgi:hypothetical protein
MSGHGVVLRAASRALLLAVIALPAQTHHSFARFDPDRRIELTGTVKEFQWTNPHVYLELYVPRPGADPERWLLESGSPNQLSRDGWTRNSIHAGDRVTVTVSPLKSGRNGGWILKCVLPGGQTLGR